MMTSTSNPRDSYTIVPKATQSALQIDENQMHVGNHPRRNHGGVTFNFQMLEDDDKPNNTTDTKPLIDIVRERRNAFEKKMLEKKKMKKRRKAAKKAKGNNASQNLNSSSGNIPTNTSNCGFSLPNPCGIFPGTIEIGLQFHPYTSSPPQQDEGLSPFSRPSNGGYDAKNINNKITSNDRTSTIPSDSKHITVTTTELCKQEKTATTKKKTPQIANQAMTERNNTSNKSNVAFSVLANSCKQNETISSKSGLNETSEGEVQEETTFVRLPPSILKTSMIGTRNSTQRSNKLEPNSSTELHQIMRPTAPSLTNITKTTPPPVGGITKLTMMNSMTSSDGQRESVEEGERKSDFLSIPVPALKRQKMIIHTTQNAPKSSLSSNRSEGSSESGKGSRVSFSKWTTGLSKLSFNSGLSKHASKRLNGTVVESNDKIPETKSNPIDKGSLARKKKSNPFAGKTRSSLDVKKTTPRKEAATKKRVERPGSDVLTSKSSRKCRKTRVEQLRTVGKDTIAEHFGGSGDSQNRRRKQQLHTKSTQKRKRLHGRKQKTDGVPNQARTSADPVKPAVEFGNSQNKNQSAQEGEPIANAPKPCITKENTVVTAQNTSVEKNTVTDDLLLIPKESEGIEVCSVSTTNPPGHGSHIFHGNPEVTVEPASAAEMSDLTSDAFGKKIPIEEQFYISVKRRVPKKAAWQDSFGTGANSLISYFGNLAVTNTSRGNEKPAKKVNPFQQYHQSAKSDLRGKTTTAQTRAYSARRGLLF